MLGDPLHLLAILILLGVANGTPIFARKLLGYRLGAPLNGEEAEDAPLRLGTEAGPGRT